MSTKEVETVAHQLEVVREKGWEAVRADPSLLKTAEEPPPPAPPQETAVVRRSYGSLYQCEDDLDALAQTDDMVPDDQRQEYLTALQDQLAKTVDKRDSVCRFLAHLESQRALVKAEKDRLTALEKHYGVVEDRIKDSIRNTILNLGPDAKGKYRKLEGTLNVLSIQKNPDSVHVTKEEDIPLKFKNAVLTMDAEVWNTLLEDLFPEDRNKILAAISKSDLAVRVNDVKEALKNAPVTRAAELEKELGRKPTDEEVQASLDARPAVPGAHLTSGYRVVRK